MDGGIGVGKVINIIVATTCINFFHF